jgi:HK97 family phage prohead protease
MEPDFSGYATKAGLKCSDGRTITPEAFKHMHGEQVPLVWQHGHNSAENVLGHAVLEARADGVYAYGFFNDTKSGVTAKQLVEHKDINKMSIFANQLVEKSKTVHHGQIKEVSLVLAGANPGAKIDYVRVQHSDDPEDFDVVDDEAVIHTGLQLEFLEYEGDEETEEVVEHADAQDMTVQDIIDSMTEPQRNVLNYMVGAALEDNAPSGDNAAQHSDDNQQTDDNTAEGKADESLAHAHQEGKTDVSNVFEQNAGGQAGQGGYTLTHADMDKIFKQGKRLGSFRDSIRQFVQGLVDDGTLKHDELAHGINTIDVLFPEAKNYSNQPDVVKRRTEWVNAVLNGLSHTPFTRVKSIVADLTLDQARARGYVKADFKKEQWFGVTTRKTSPTTVYIKQKLDRDDILDITDFKVVNWMMAQMRVMLDEEIARAVLIGDGRAVDDVDKIKDPAGASSGDGIRSIYNDHDLYASTIYVNVDDSGSTYDEVVDSVMDGMEFYKGTGSPVFFTTTRELNNFKKSKDTTGRRLYENNQAVADALGVSAIYTVEPMYDVTDLVGIIVNLTDYNTGTDQGGEINQFEQFDIDYNQEKYLLETRLSGALVKVKSALIIKKTAAGNALVVPTKPTFVASTGVVTIPTQTGVVYKQDDGTTTISAGAMTAIAAGTSVTIKSVPASGYYFPDNQRDQWTFERPAA